MSQSPKNPRMMKHRRRHSNGPRGGGGGGNQGGHNPGNEGLPADLTDEEVNAELALQSVPEPPVLDGNVAPPPQAVAGLEGMSEDGDAVAAPGANGGQQEYRPPVPAKILRIPDLKRQTAAELLE